MNKEHVKMLAKDFVGDYDCTNNSDAIVFAIKFLEHLIEKGEIVDRLTYDQQCQVSTSRREKIEQLQVITSNMISDEHLTDGEIITYFHNHADCFADAEGTNFPIPAMTEVSALEFIKWYRAQLTPKP